MHILITRPEGQALNLCEAITALGATAFHFPCIEIQGISDESTLQNEINKLNKIDIAIFISPNAVRFAAPLIKESWPVLPEQLQIAAMGEATADALQSIGIPVDIVPTETFSTEALLKHPQLADIQSKTILIIRGQEGRRLLAEMLTERGAHIQHAIAYQRILPLQDASELLSYWQEANIDIIVISSVQSLENLFAIIEKTSGEPALTLLQNTQFIVSSQRICNAVTAKGIKKRPHIARNASDNAIMTMIETLFKEHRKS